LAASLLALPGCGKKPPPAYDAPPVLINREEITAALHAVGAGLETRVVLHVWVDEKGYVREARIARSSGVAELDDAAVWIGEQMRFKPALFQGQPVPAWVEVPVTFDVVSRVVRPPRLRNAEEVAAVIARDYPDLRGTARLRVLVGAEGWVKETRERRPYDPEVMDAARELIDRQIKFWPAYKEGRQIAVWVNLVIEFAGPNSRIYIESSET
jgi:TonB family protein